MATIKWVRYEPGLGGMQIELAVEDGDNIGADTPNGFRWVQTVDTNDPLSGDPNPKVDNSGNPIDPFYMTGQMKTTPNWFEDLPHRSVPAAGQVLNWKATVALCAVDLKKKWLVIHDIRTWGFKLKLAAGSKFTGDLDPLPLTTDWSAKIPLITIVRQYHPDWQFALSNYPQPPRKLF